jgi:hypothetical protein
MVYSSLQRRHRPLCAQCKVRMMLVRISPVIDGSDAWFFECDNCGGATVERIFSGQMNLDS